MNEGNAPSGRGPEVLLSASQSTRHQERVAAKYSADSASQAGANKPKGVVQDPVSLTIQVVHGSLTTRAGHRRSRASTGPPLVTQRLKVQRETRVGSR